MNDIRSLIRIAAGRIGLNAFLDHANVMLMVAGGVALLLLLVERATPVVVVPWLWAGPTMIALGFAAAFAVWHRRRRTELQVATIVDERLDLRERLSTALHCAGRDDVFAQAAIEDAVHAARDKRNIELARRRFAVEAPTGWWGTPLLVLAILGAAFVPHGDLFARDAVTAADVEQAVQQSNDAIEQVLEEIQKNEDLADELDDVLAELTDEGLDGDRVKTPEEIRREAIKRGTKLNEKLDDLLNGDRSRALESLKKQLSQMDTPQDGPAKDMADALSKGDFSTAQKALKEMMEELASGEMDPDKAAELAKQLEDIGKQLQELAKQQKQLEQALEQAGMDPQLAQNPQAMQQALDKNTNLNQQQKQQLQQMAQAQQAAAQMCQGLGKACKQMAQGAQQGQPGQAGNQMGQMLSDLESLQQMLQQAQLASKACQGQCQGLGQGLAQQWQQIQNLSRGGAFGQRGQGEGGNAPISPTPWKTKDAKETVKNTGGDIIARQLIQGEQIVGEAKTKLMRVVTEAAEGYEEGQIEERIPAKYADSQKHYFGEVKKRLEQVQGTSEPAGDPESDGEAGTE